jgi:energy-coupling factor transporter ATP-binding protein EcfA2
MTVATLSQPHRVRDLRGQDVHELVFPPRAVVLLAGIPGAGKTTLLRRLYGLTGREQGPVHTDDGAVVLDSEHARNRWATWLRPIPYRFWRPLVHLTHYRRLWAAVRQGTEPIVLHECGTRGWLFHSLVRHAARHGREVHVVLLDVPAPVAEASQRLRGRRVHPGRFLKHARRWRRMVAKAEHGGEVLPEARTVTLIDRYTANRLTGLTFRGPARPGATRRP